jgi:hypothetical protein
MEAFSSEAEGRKIEIEKEAGEEKARGYIVISYRDSFEDKKEEGFVV